MEEGFDIVANKVVSFGEEAVDECFNEYVQGKMSDPFQHIQATIERCQKEQALSPKIVLGVSSLVALLVVIF